MLLKIKGLLLIHIFIPIVGISQIIDDTVILTRIQGLRKLENIMEVVDSFYKNHSETSTERREDEQEDDGESPYLIWKRWEWYNSTRLNEQGEVINTAEKNWEAYQQRARNENATARNYSTGNWNFLGPTNVVNTIDKSTGGKFDNYGVGKMSRIAFHPTNANIIYAGSASGGLFKTTDAGRNWFPISSYSANLGVSGIVVDRTNPNNIYVLTGETNIYIYNLTDTGFYANPAKSCVGVMKSIDGGTTWLMTGGMANGAFLGYKLIQSPTEPNTLFAATSRGLFKTVNNGDTWTNINPQSMFDVQCNPKNGQKIYASGNSYFQYSNDGGASWQSSFWPNSQVVTSSNNLSRTAIGITSLDTSIVYLFSSSSNSSQPGVAEFKGLYRSNNGGVSFTMVSNTPDITGTGNFGEGGTANYGSIYCTMTISPYNISQLAFGVTTIWASSNGGNSFYHVANYKGGPIDSVHCDIHELAYNPLDGRLYAATDGGMYVSLNNGTNWTNISRGLGVSQIYHFAGYPNDRTHIMTGNQDLGLQGRASFTGIFKHIASADGFSIAYDPNNKAQLYATINSLGIWNKTNATFDTSYNCCVKYFNNFFPVVGRHPTNSNIIFVGDRDTLYTSNNEMVNISNRVPIGSNRAVKFSPSNPNRIFIAAKDSIYRSIDGGNTWIPLNNKTGFPSAPFFITDIGLHPTNQNIVYVTFGGYMQGKKVYYSFDGGENWSSMSAQLPNLPINCVEVDVDNSVYVGTDDGVYYQSSTTSQWLPFYNGLPHIPITDLQIFKNDGFIFASTYGNGMWYSELKQLCDADVVLSDIQGGPQLYQANNTITTSQTIQGGEGTRVFYKAGSSVTLTPGFEATSGNEVRAYIGACDEYVLPQFKSGKDKEWVPSPNYFIESDSNQISQFPYGYLEYTHIQRQKNELEIIIKQSGDYKIIMADREGKPAKVLMTEKLKKGIHRIKIQTNLLEGSPACYLELRKENKLCHFLEW